MFPYGIIIKTIAAILVYRYFNDARPPFKFKITAALALTTTFVFDWLVWQWGSALILIQLAIAGCIWVHLQLIEEHPF